MSQGGLGSTLFAALLMFNPADVFRLMNIFSSEQVQTMYGLATVMPERLTDPAVLLAIMLAWIVVPFFIAHWRFTCQAK
jgi:Cu-processing system permease protein